MVNKNVCCLTEPAFETRSRRLTLNRDRLFSREFVDELPFVYEKIAPTTWAFLSSLLMFALFFKFERFWSVRNFDLVLIVLLVPGILFVDHGVQLNARATALAVMPGAPPTEPGVPPELDASSDAQIYPEAELVKAASRYYQLLGYYWLLSVCVVFLIRMLLDPALVRRPLLPPNLTIGGMVFLACSLMVFLIANVVSSKPIPDDISGAQGAVKIVQRSAADNTAAMSLRKHGPGFPLFHLLPIIPMFSNEELMETNVDQDPDLTRYVNAAKTLAILGQIAIVIALILMGRVHFGNFGAGVGMACIYLMLPYTSQFTGHVIHVLPGALMIWALFCYRSPIGAGIFIGLATGVAYYPIFLLPLWISFYWERGVKRFLFGVTLALAICIFGLFFTSVDAAHFGRQLQAMFGFWRPIMDGLGGIWALGWDRWYRVPILAAFVALCASFAFWPIRKDIGVLTAYTCAVMVGVQFWHGFEGGLLMAWYIPAALITIFRPNTDGRVAANELRERVARKAETAEDLLPVTP